MVAELLVGQVLLPDQLECQMEEVDSRIVGSRKSRTDVGEWR